MFNKPKHEQVLDLLSDYKPHFSSEFRDKLGLLEYRRRLSDLRERGHRIVAVRVNKRPAYQLQRPLNEEDLFRENA